MRGLWKRIGVGLLSITLLIGLAACGDSSDSGNSGSGSGSSNSFKLGMLWATTGSGEVIDQVSKKAAELAIEEVNADGGINGHQIETVTKDYASDESTTVEKTKELLLEDEVDCIIGLTLGSTRVAAVPVLEEYNGLLIYPTIFDGEEESDNIIYTGGTSYTMNKELIPWLTENQGTKFYLVGSDYSYPVNLNNQVTALLEENDGEVVGEEYVTMEKTDMSSVINKIKSSGADVVYCSLVGNSMYSFYQQCEQYGLDTSEVTIASVIATEMDAINIGDSIEGTYTSFHWFQSYQNDMSTEFIVAYTEKYGAEEASLLSGTPEVTYSSIKMLAASLNESGVEDFTTENIVDAMVGYSMDTPQGAMEIADNHYANTIVFIAQWNADGTANILYQSDTPVEAEPWPSLLYPDGNPAS